MDRRRFLKSVSVGMAGLTGLTSCGKQTERRLHAGLTAGGRKPNILLIMADDMGYSDIGCYGSEVHTPNLDALAANGLRFTQFYNTARCCPTRASLLTGLYQHQAGVGHMMRDQKKPGFRGCLNDNCVTIAEAMKTAGYSTYMCGKWHVASPTPAEKGHWPLQRGFDKFYGTIHGAGSFYDPNTLTRGNEFISPYNDPQYKVDKYDYYYTDAISDNTVEYLSQHGETDGDEPFFMYIAYTAAHWPMHAPEEDIKKYEGKYDDGYEPIRKARFERMKELGVIEGHRKLSPRAGDWEKVKNKKWEARCMEVYAAMIDRMDQGIGKIVDELKRQGQLENTLILFLQDNGGCAEGLGRRGEFKPRPDKPPHKPMKDDELQTKMIPHHTRYGYPVRTGSGVMPGPADTYIAYGRNWANVSNTPFREYKHWVHEGGIATPLIVHWPAGFEAKGKLRREPSHLIDIMATCVDVAGANYPDSRGGNKITPMEGQSLSPVFAGKSLKERPLFWEHEGNAALRLGRWKLVCKKGVGKGDTVRPDRWELYDMEKDRSELNNLADNKPEKVKEMLKMWKDWARRAHVFPHP